MSTRRLHPSHAVFFRSRCLLPLAVVAGAAMACASDSQGSASSEAGAPMSETSSDGTVSSPPAQSSADVGPIPTPPGSTADSTTGDGDTPLGTASPSTSAPLPETSTAEPAHDAGVTVDDVGNSETLPTGTIQDPGTEPSATPSGSETDGDTSTASPEAGVPAAASELLVPAQGALLGAYYGDRSIDDTAAALGRTLPLHLTYYAWTDDWTRDNTAEDLANGRTPFVNWELYEGGELQQIIAGEFDDMLVERAAAAAELDAKLFVDLGAEMNGEWSPWSGAENGQSADSYVAMYRHVHDAFDDAKNIIWVWCPNVTDEPREDWNAALNYYPGDDYVDWTCVDGYNWGDTGGGGWETFEEIFQSIYPQLAQKQKPIMIGEMASAESGGDKAQWLNQLVPTLTSEYPQIKALIWFDVDKETDWRIGSSPEAEAAFKSMANDPYLNP